MEKPQRTTQPEERPQIKLGEISLVYKMHVSTGNFESDKKIVKNHFDKMASLLTKRLTNELQGEITIGSVAYKEGSVEVTAFLFGAWMFIFPIFQSYIANQFPSLKELFGNDKSLSKSESEEEFIKVKKILKRTTKMTIEEFEHETPLKAVKVTVVTEEIETVINEIIVKSKP